MKELNLEGTIWGCFVVLLGPAPNHLPPFSEAVVKLKCDHLFGYCKDALHDDCPGRILQSPARLQCQYQVRLYEQMAHYRHDRHVHTVLHVASQSMQPAAWICFISLPAHMLPYACRHGAGITSAIRCVCQNLISCQTSALPSQPSLGVPQLYHHGQWVLPCTA